MKKGVKLLILSCLLFSSFFFFNSCSGDKKKRGADEATSALIEANENLVAFGHVDVYGILNKTGYQSIPKVNMLLGAVIDKWKSGIDIEKPIYFAIEAPFDNNGNPKSAIALLDIKNQDSIKSVISEMGYSMEKNEDIAYYQENDVTFGIRNNLLIVISKTGEYDGKAAIKEAFLQTEGDLSEDKTADILSTQGDIVSGLNIERLFKTSNTDLAKLDDQKKKELENLVNDAFFQSVVKFENGQATFETMNLFSEELKNMLFFKDKNGNTLTKQLGGGSPWMGMAMNLDVRKGEEFLSKYLPETRKELVESLPTEINLALMSLGENPLSKLFSGQFGAITTGDAQSAMGMEFEFASYLGLGQKGELVKNIVDEQLSGVATKKGDTFYIGEATQIKTTKNGIFARGGKAASGALDLPSYAKNFGEDSFSFFLAFDRIDIASLELEDEAKVLELVKYVTVNGDRNGSKTTIALKKNDKNILKQIADYYTNQLMDQISGIGM